MRPLVLALCLVLVAIVAAPLSAGPFRRAARGVKAAVGAVREKKPLRRVVKKILPPYGR